MEKEASHDNADDRLRQRPLTSVNQPPSSDHEECNSLSEPPSRQHPLDGKYAALPLTSFQHRNPYGITDELDNSTSTAPVFTSRTEGAPISTARTEKGHAAAHAQQDFEFHDYYDIAELPNFGQDDPLSYKNVPADSKPQLGRLPSLAQTARWQPALLSARQSRTYGTFTIDSIRGRLLDLDAYLRVARQEVRGLLWYVLLSTLFWPISWLFATCASYKAAVTERKDLQMLSSYLVMGTCIGAVLWLGPSLCLLPGASHERGFWTGALHYISDLLFNAEITTYDFAMLALAQILLFFLLTFAWTYHQIGLDMDRYKSATENSWAARQDSWGHHVVIPDDQKGHFSAFLRTETSRPHLNRMYLWDMVELLRQMPGWCARSDFQATDFEEQIHGVPCGIFSKLEQDSVAAVEKGLWSHDVYVMWAYQHGDYISVCSRLHLMCLKLIALLAYVGSELCKTPFTLMFVIVFAVTRVALPRLWLWIVLDGMLFPKQVAPIAIVVVSSILTFFTSFFWIGLFLVILQEYKRNVSQSLLISGLIDPRSRIDYARRYLQGCSKDQVENIMCCMPLIALINATNVSAFWKLREYGVLDRAKARMAMEVLMDMVLIWLIISIMVVLFLMSTLQPYTAWAPVLLLDMLVFGWLTLHALRISLQISDAQDKHVKVLAESQYDVAQKCAELKEGAVATARTRDAPSPTITDLESASTLLSKYISMVKEDDSRDTILLGMRVSPAAVLCVVALGCTVLVLICIKMSSLGLLSAGQPQPQTIRMLNSRSAISTALKHTLHMLHLA
eukprot:gnl/MRDRNA2_/MRDRNA2_102533_c0_seq1.p1 gnl/MRDRNA2_/MRDRNA2_102533_c0~~gnl/MRDRNA2_/MRDRNA2_102533_c0_seq1.p1  ORF type:complete len:790 (-),score=107.23 gnl/MRDRNA2_/MRDRNA2_102533_c0_seq1:9-2378(-)